MAHIYLSSTYSDLSQARERVYRALRQMRHDVIAMEDYVAADQRPVDKCLADVSECDIYVGIFAWRYGYVPEKQNLSVTELEFRQAVRTEKPCLLFLLGEAAPWPRNLIDRDSTNIERLRAELRRDYLVSEFQTIDELAAAVSVAVANINPAALGRKSVATPGGVPTQPIGKLASVGFPAAEKVVFADDFSANELSECWQPVSGEWCVKDGVLNGVGAHYTGGRRREWAAITLNKDIPNDCSVSFRTRIVDGSTAELMLHLSSNKYVRVYLYSIDQGLYFGDGTFMEVNKPGQVGLETVLESIGGGPTLAAHGFPVRLNVWYGISATAAGKKYTAKVGGLKLIEYVDENAQLSNEGSIGFLTNGHVQFDEVIITSGS